MCLLSAIAGIWARGMDNNLFTQIGLVVLIGLACKNAILIVEFAKQLQEKGSFRLDAILQACDLRLRPILMTSFAFTFGVLPLMVSRGAGAEMRQSMGTAVFFGMLGVTFFGIFFTPVFYLVIRKVLERGKGGGAGLVSAPTPSGAASGALVLLVSGAGWALGLNGCSVGPDFHKPKPQTPAAFGNAQESGFTPAAVEETRWWGRWNDPLLDGLIDEALESNKDLKIATARIREEKALHTSAVLDAFPVAQGEANFVKSVAAKDAFFGWPRSLRQTELYTVGADATWEVDLFGRVRRSIEASSADLAAAEADRRGVMVSLAAEVAGNYLELRGAQKELDVARQNAENQKATLKITETQLKAGTGNELDLARGRAQLDATLSAIPPLESQVKQTIYRISVLTGKQPTVLEPTLAPPAPLPQLPEHVAVGNPQDLLRRRPDIQRAEAALAAATAQVGVATADLFPRVTFQGNFGLSASQIGKLSEAGADTYAFGPHISWAALDLGHVRARIKAADARTDAQLALYEKTVLEALEETESALVGYGKAQAQTAQLGAAAGEARRAVELARLQYDRGVGDFLNVLDAQRTQFTIEDQLAQTETQSATALVSVYKALGGPIEPQRKGAKKSAHKTNVRIRRIRDGA